MFIDGSGLPDISSRLLLTKEIPACKPFMSVFGDGAILKILYFRWTRTVAFWAKVNVREVDVRRVNVFACRMYFRLFVRYLCQSASKKSFSWDRWDFFARFAGASSSWISIRFSGRSWILAAKTLDVAVSRPVSPVARGPEIHSDFCAKTPASCKRCGGQW